MSKVKTDPKEPQYETESIKEFSERKTEELEEFVQAAKLYADTTIATSTSENKIDELGARFKGLLVMRLSTDEDDRIVCDFCVVRGFSADLNIRIVLSTINRSGKLSAPHRHIYSALHLVPVHQGKILVRKDEFYNEIEYYED